MSAGAVDAEPARQAMQDGVGQLGDVFAALAQRRHAQLDHVDAVVEVFAELRLRHQVGEVLVRGRQDAHVDRRLALLADGPHGLFLDHAQQLHLHVQRQVGDLVEEQRAAFGGRESGPPCR